MSCIYCYKDGKNPNLDTFQITHQGALANLGTIKGATLFRILTRIDEEIKNGTSGQGWTPEFQFEKVGDLTLFKLVDYFGGTGDKPSEFIGQYLSNGGYTTDPMEALDLSLHLTIEQQQEIADLLKVDGRVEKDNMSAVCGDEVYKKTIDSRLNSLVGDLTMEEQSEIQDKLGFSSFSNIYDLFPTGQFTQELLEKEIVLDFAVAIQQGKMLTVSFQLTSKDTATLNIDSGLLFGLPTVIVNKINNVITQYVPQVRLFNSDHFLNNVVYLDLRDNMVKHTEGLSIQKGVVSYSAQLQIL